MIRAMLLSLALLVPNMLAAQQGDDFLGFALDDPAMVTGMSQDEAAYFASLLSENPVPEGWK
ncbi:hypothetical protein [Octadecabacter sp. R77987]|uniref:hypothetical protein n=1 Tax=Octadecabacter sp. R77987 TaxID=3093874 RepID=UPI00366D43A8